MRIYLVLMLSFISAPTFAQSDCKQRIQVQVEFTSGSSDNIGENFVKSRLAKKLSGKLYIKERTSISCTYSNHKTGVELSLKKSGTAVDISLSHEDYWESRYSGDFSQSRLEAVFRSTNLRGRHFATVVSATQSYDSGCGFTECSNTDSSDDSIPSTQQWQAEILIK